MYKLPNGKMVYPEDIQCVHQPTNGKGGVWIGNLEAAENIQTLKKHGIKAILTAAKGVFLNHSKTQIPYQLYIPGEDHQKFDMSKYFNQSVNFIRETLDKTNILVHCLAGVSRSVSLVMAYFIKHYDMSYDNVYTKIKSRRKIIHPNDGFITQLRKFQIQCRQSGPALRKNEYHQMRSSYSPQKRHQRRDFQGYQPSPQKFYQSPQKRYSRYVNDYKYLKSYEDNNEKVASRQVQSIKNPELYKSIAQDLRKQSQLKQYTHPKHISPDKYLKENKLGSSFGLKRLSSMNVSFQRPNQNMKRSQIYSNYQKYQPRGRVASDYQPLDSIQNRQYQMNTQIDRKIAQIRKKYQQYTKQPQKTHDRIRIQRKYSNISTVQESNNQNSNFDDLLELKMRRIGTDLEPAKNDIYGGVGVVRNNNYIINEAPTSSSVKFAGSRLRRLQSYQV